MAPARSILREAIDTVRKGSPFRIDAMVLLPDHVHCIWTLPHTDTDYSTRWRKIKERFTRKWLRSHGREHSVTTGQFFKGQRGVWQSRFWEHTIRDENDFNAHMDYIHYNPVKHGYVRCPHDWRWTSFHRCVREGLYAIDWACTCRGIEAHPPHLETLEGKVGE